MEEIGLSNDRQIMYTNIWRDDKWLDKLPNNNWLAFTIGQDKDINLFKEFADTCIDNHVLYLCAAGHYCKNMHDEFDNRIIERKIEKNESIDSPNDFVDSPLTTWHDNFSEGFWFAINTAYHEIHPINKIVCIDFTNKGVRKNLTRLIKKINKHWFPSDGEKEEPVYDT